WGQRQAARGDCWLMRRRGLGAELVVYQQVEVESTLLREKLLQNLEDKLILTREYAAVRFGKLEESDEEVVTALQRAAAHDPIVLVREAAQKALQSPAHQKFLAQKSSMTLQGQLETAQPPTNPQIEYEQAVVLLNAGDRDKAVEKFAFAFRLGSRNLRVQALAQLESLNEVEVF
ncbi:MAG TPA: hypothetical protein VI451_13910, partial [Anaerolineales bacterium]|nr:hypothetical protein [Anaerolineales bacterium]